MWGIGVATQKVNLNQVPLGRDTNSLVLRHDGSVYHNNEEKNRLPANNLPQEGDIVVSGHFMCRVIVDGYLVYCHPDIPQLINAIWFYSTGANV